AVLRFWVYPNQHGGWFGGHLGGGGSLGPRLLGHHPNEHSGTHFMVESRRVAKFNFLRRIPFSTSLGTKWAVISSR
ncbi:hypothetical protein HAX54_042267, partial [Datura stramonium]|nr:hypothetical protein [Datura stramonium]